MGALFAFGAGLFGGLAQQQDKNDQEARNMRKQQFDYFVNIALPAYNKMEEAAGDQARAINLIAPMLGGDKEMAKLAVARGITPGSPDFDQRIQDFSISYTRAPKPAAGGMPGLAMPDSAVGTPAATDSLSAISGAPSGGATVPISGTSATTPAGTTQNAPAASVSPLIANGGSTPFNLTGTDNRSFGQKIMNVPNAAAVTNSVVQSGMEMTGRDADAVRVIMSGKNPFKDQNQPNMEGITRTSRDFKLEAIVDKLFSDGGVKAFKSPEDMAASVKLLEQYRKSPNPALLEQIFTHTTTKRDDLEASLQNKMDVAQLRAQMTSDMTMLRIQMAENKPLNQIQTMQLQWLQIANDPSRPQHERDSAFANYAASKGVSPSTVTGYKVIDSVNTGAGSVATPPTTAQAGAAKATQTQAPVPPPNTPSRPSELPSNVPWSPGTAVGKNSKGEWAVIQNGVTSIYDKSGKKIQ